MPTVIRDADAAVRRFRRSGRRRRPGSRAFQPEPPPARRRPGTLHERRTIDQRAPERPCKSVSSVMYRSVRSPTRRHGGWRSRWVRTLAAGVVGALGAVGRDLVADQQRAVAHHLVPPQRRQLRRVERRPRPPGEGPHGHRDRSRLRRARTAGTSSGAITPWARPSAGQRRRRHGVVRDPLPPQRLLETRLASTRGCCGSSARPSRPRYAVVPGVDVGDADPCHGQLGDRVAEQGPPSARVRRPRRQRPRRRAVLDEQLDEHGHRLASGCRSRSQLGRAAHVAAANRTAIDQQQRYETCTPLNARAITRRWISEVPSKIV